LGGIFKQLLDGVNLRRDLKFRGQFWISVESRSSKSTILYKFGSKQSGLKRRQSKNITSDNTFSVLPNVKLFEITSHLRLFTFGKSKQVNLDDNINVQLG
jgi:hypothetical protein